MKPAELSFNKSFEWKNVTFYAVKAYSDILLDIFRGSSPPPNRQDLRPCELSSSSSSHLREGRYVFPGIGLFIGQWTTSRTKYWSAHRENCQRRRAYIQRWKISLGLNFGSHPDRDPDRGIFKRIFAIVTRERFVGSAALDGGLRSPSSVFVYQRPLNRVCCLSLLSVILRYSEGNSSFGNWYCPFVLHQKPLRNQLVSKWKRSLTCRAE